MKKFYKVTEKSFNELGVTTTKELWEKVKDEHQGLSFDSNTVFKSAEADNKFHVVFSTDSEDRHLERVYQNFDLKHFKNNPVFLDSHNYGSIEHILGIVDNVKVKENQLQGDVIFALDNPKGLLAYKLAKGGFLNATSIGFIPLDFDEQGNITKSQLLEISAVSVPANPEALFERKDFVVEDVVEEPKKIKKDITIYKAVKTLRKEQQDLFLSIVKGLQIKNPQERQRKVFKLIRENLKQR